MEIRDISPLRDCQLLLNLMKQMLVRSHVSDECMMFLPFTFCRNLERQKLIHAPKLTRRSKQQLQPLERLFGPSKYFSRNTVKIITELRTLRMSIQTAFPQTTTRRENYGQFRAECDTFATQVFALLAHVLSAALQSSAREEFVRPIMTFSEDHQDALMEIVQDRYALTCTCAAYYQPLKHFA